MTEFVSRSYGQEGYEVIIKTDSQEHCKKIENFARLLIDHTKPQTNADRIRAMSDVEIAKLFTQAVANGCPPQMDWTCIKDEEGWDGCDKCWCKWLQQPAEEVPK